MKTKQLIKELKEEIEKRKERCKIYGINMHKDRELARLKAQLQFAEKLIKAIKSDVELIIHNNLFEKIDWIPHTGKDTKGKISVSQIDNLKEEINKILDEALK